MNGKYKSTMLKNKVKLITKDLMGRSRKIEHNNIIGDLVGGFLSLTIAMMALEFTTSSLIKSGVLDNYLESEVRVRGREVARG